MVDDLQNIHIPVDELASWLCLTETRVQQLAKKGIVVKTEHGVYQLKASVQGYIREMNAKADGKNSEYHKHRTRKIKIAADDADRLFKMEMGKLVNAEKYQIAREKKDADIKQKILAFEKILPQKTGGLPAEAQVPIIRNEIRKLLTELAATERPVGGNRTGGQDLSAASKPVGQPVGGPEPQTQQ